MTALSVGMLVGLGFLGGGIFLCRYGYYKIASIRAVKDGTQIMGRVEDQSTVKYIHDVTEHSGTSSTQEYRDMVTASRGLKTVLPFALGIFIILGSLGWVGLSTFFLLHRQGFIILNDKLRLENKGLENLNAYKQRLSENKGLKDLLLSNNKLKELPEEIGDLKKLNYLNLNYNQFEVFPPVITRLHWVRSVRLSNNQLSRVSVNLSQLTRLRGLDIRNNRLTFFDFQGDAPPSLMTLELSMNQIHRLGAGLIGHKELFSLNLNQNRLRSLPDLSKMEGLEHLKLNDNELRDLPASLARLKKLRFLHLNNNKFKTIPAVLHQMDFLTELYLRGHSFRKEDEQKLAKTLAKNVRIYFR